MPKLCYKRGMQDSMMPSSPEATPSPNEIPQAERNWAMAAHIAPLCGYIGIPFGHLIAPLIIMIMKKETMPSVAREAKEALNFNISMTIYLIVAAVLCTVLIGFLLVPALIIAHLIISIMTGIKAGEGKPGFYPYTLRFIS